MSPTIFCAGRVGGEVPAHEVGDACSWPSPSVRLSRHGRGWQGSRPSSRMSDRTSSGPAGTPQAGQVGVDPPVPVRAVGILE